MWDKESLEGDLQLINTPSVIQGLVWKPAPDLHHPRIRPSKAYPKRRLCGLAYCMLIPLNQRNSDCQQIMHSLVIASMGVASFAASSAHHWPANSNALSG
ncbi:hypothetical protein TNIN_134931 [Trichonephila inaurata madagascariensis]|uniref:Uncharacterized protein n=1 Tax=Trichonephila inaurata madagascariensis TaxID=2747483 RepID=A0A8X6I5M0_9ARAC|nr:hypothetical protein TNIN_134931 [Trichonephila inaurata madagascariensis]